MEKQVYITEEERVKCKKVAEAFTELYEMADIVVVDVGKYGFVMLKYYMPPQGFEEDETYTDSRALFEGLWQVWRKALLYWKRGTRVHLRACRKKNSRYLSDGKLISQREQG